jgi:hypothetical protein
MRFADIVLNHTVLPPPLIVSKIEVVSDRRSIIEVHTGYVHRFISTMPIIAVDNAYRYVKAPEFTTTNQYLYDLPSIAPPFPALWAEWMQDNGKPVGVMATIEEGPFNVDGLPEWGETYENNLRWLKRPSSASISAAIPFLPGDKHSRWISNNLDREGWKRVRWLWQLDFYQGDGAKVVMGPLFTLLVATNERGKLIDLTFTAFSELGADQNWLITFLQAMAFLHCRNVNLAKIAPSAALSKKHRKKGKIAQDLLSYHVIEIEPFGRNQSASTGGFSDRSASRLHIARGSFHHYGNCCPDDHPPKGLLFGKHEGVYWVPQHLRGDPERGTVISDYEIGETS